MEEGKKKSQAEMDYIVNRYTLRCLRITIVITAVVWIANICGIFIINSTLMSVGFTIAISIIVATQIFGKLVDLHKPWVKYVLIFNTTLAIAVDGITLSYHAVLLSALPLLLAAQYTSRKFIIYTYFITVVGVFVSVMGSYYWGLCDLNMLVLTTEPTKYYLSQVGNTISFSLSDMNPMYSLTFFYAVPRCLILLCLLPVIRSISRNIKKQAEYAADMKYLSEKDEMTGLYNKNKYLAMMEKTYPKLSTVAVVFWDVNNLKVINDTLGHAQGDYVITVVARMIKELMDESKKAYRIGGDEFVMVMENPKRGEVDEIIRRWGEITERVKPLSTVEISVALGFAWGAGKNVADVAKEADESMYYQKNRSHGRRAE